MPHAPGAMEEPAISEQRASIGRRVLAGTGWNMGWRVATRSLDFISLLVLARLLIPADFGIVALASSVSASIDALSQLGVKDALVRLHDERRDYYDTAFTFQVIRGALTAVLLAGFSQFSDAWLGDARLHDILLIMAALALVAGAENIGVVTFTRELNFRMQVMMQAVPRVLGFLTTVGLALALRNYWAIVGGIVVLRTTGVAITYVAAPHRPRFGLTGWRYLASFSFWAWAGSLAGIIWGRSDGFLLGPVLGPSILGIYMMGVQLALMPVTELLEPACAALFPGFAMAQRGGAKPTAMALGVTGVLVLATIPFSIGVSACSGYLVTALLGPQWQEARLVIAILAFVCLFSPFSYVCSSVLSAQGHVRSVFVTNAIAAAVKVTVVLSVRQTHDLPLIAVAAVAVVSGEALLFLWQLRAGSTAEFRQLVATLIRAFFAAIVTTAFAYFLLPGSWSVVTLDRIPALAAGGAVGASTFLIFWICHALFWLAAGRPAGAEARVASLFHGLVQRVAWGRSVNQNP
ncbi:MAG: oligosaccharide flippase family protein [Alphaproteobacteria bacterium]|nr:oligosaccharide flippase family protein [Alphaproteobacteria bacterium]